MIRRIYGLSLALLVILVMAFDTWLAKFWKSGNEVSEETKVKHVTTATTSWKIVENFPQQVCVHPNASIVDDVLGIEHHAEESTIVIRLKANGRCPTPYIRGRLSGPALVMLENWQYHYQQNKNVNEDIFMKATYRAPLEGMYFLELVTVYCYNFLLNATNVWENDYAFASACTEPAVHRRLTADDTTIQVTSLTNLPDGYWNAKHQDDAVPLYTRFQLPSCYRNPDPKCNTPLQSPKPFARYEWQSQRIHSPPNIQNNSTAPVICVIGSSHARKLEATLRHLAQNTTPWWSPATTIYHDARIPRQVHAGVLNRLLRKYHCTHFVISLGQWPAGKRFKITQDNPYSFQKLYNSYKTMLENILQVYPHVPVFVRSINYNPLGALIGSCPPSDWRSPLVIDGYNAAIQQVVQEIGAWNIRFIDTNHVVGPMWDAAVDWCHLGPPVSNIHAQEVLRQVFSGFVTTAVENSF